MKVATRLTLRQEAFARAYLETGNASEAYRRAYNTENWKPTSSEVNACKQLRHTKIALRIQELQDQASQRNDVTSDWIIQELKAHALADTTKPSVKVRALEPLGKQIGMFVERTENKNLNLNIDDIKVIEVVRSHLKPE